MSTVTTPRIYLDNAATTRIDAEVLDAMLPWLGVGRVLELLQQKLNPQRSVSAS